MTQAKGNTLGKGIGRIDEAGFLKAFPILGLPIYHIIYEAQEQWLADGRLDDFSSLIYMLIIFGPSVFMLCMGYGIAGGKASPKKLRQQGVQFILMNVILNIFRYFLPTVVQLLFHRQPQADLVQPFLESDIYYFVGIFFLFYSLLKQRHISALGTLLICAGMVTVNTMLAPLLAGRITNQYAEALLGNFFDFRKTGDFSLMTWAFFPAAGIMLGEILKPKEEGEKTRFTRRMLACVSAFLLSFIFFLYRSGYNLIEFFQDVDSTMDFPVAVIYLCIALILFALSRELCLRISGTRFYSFMMRLSALILPFYLVQWILVCWEMNLLVLIGLPAEGFGIGWFVISTIAIMSASIIISLRYGMRIMKPLLKITSPWRWRIGRARKA